MKKITLFFLALVLAAGCGPKKPTYDDFAEDLCKCMRPMADMQKQMMELVEAQKMDEAMALMGKGQQVDQEGQACIAELEKKHGKIEGEEAEKQAMDALGKVCPDIVALMQESAGPPMNPEDMLEEGEAVPMDTVPGE